MSKIPAGTATMPLKSVYNRTSGRLAPTIAAAVSLAAAPIPSSYQLHSSSLVASFVGEKSRQKPNRIDSYFSNQKTQRIRQYSTTMSLPDHKRIKLPALSPTMEQGSIVAWHKKEGERLAEGDVLCDIETDKVTMGFESSEDGYLAKIILPEGSRNVKVGKLICIIVDQEADISAFSKLSGDSASLLESPDKVEEHGKGALEVGNHAKATPFAKQLAEEKGLDLGEVAGSGPAGRVLAADLVTEESKLKSPARDTVEKHLDLPLLKQSISKKFVESKSKVPHYYLTSEVVLDAIEKVRQKLNLLLKSSPNPRKLSINDFLVKAAAMACIKVPETNSFFLGTHVRKNNVVDIAVTVATENGFVTPVIHDAANMGVASINDVILDFSARALSGRLQPHELQGGTFTVSATNFFGNSQDFSAILNPPQSCNLTIGKKKKRLLPDENGFRSVSILNVTLSCDHRVVDGAVGATWLKVFKEFLEKPQTMLL